MSDIFERAGYSIKIGDFQEGIETINPSIHAYVAAPHWVRYTIPSQEQLFSNDSTPDDPYGEYIRLLFVALSSTSDPSKDIDARSYEASLPKPVNWSLTAHSILGPSAKQFPDATTWISYREKIKNIWSNEEQHEEIKQAIFDLITNAFKGSNLWTTLLFHPDDWQLLVSENLITYTEVISVKCGPLGELLEIPIRSTDFCIFHLLRNELNTPHLLDILKIGVIVHSKGRLHSSTFVNGVLLRTDFSAIQGEDVYDLLDSIENPSSMPSCWIQVYLSAALNATSPNAAKIVSFWKKINHSIHPNLWIPISTSKRHELIEPLFREGSTESLEILGIVCDFQDDAEIRILKDINIQAARHILNERNALNPRVLDCLFKTTPSLDEMKIYSNPALFRQISNIQPHFTERASRRVALAVQSLNKLELPDFLSILDTIIIKIEDFPLSFCCAALDATILIDNSLRTPITEAKWQR